MSDAQMEARAIFSRLHVTFASTVHYDQCIDVIATALAAKDAELSVQVEAKEHARRECERVEAALAEARKALEPFATAADNFDGFKIANDEEWFAYGGVQSATGSKGAIAVADLRAARRALTGGQEDG